MKVMNLYERTSSTGIVSSDLAKIGMVLHYSVTLPSASGFHQDTRDRKVSSVRCCCWFARTRPTLRPEELARDVESFAAHYHDLLTIKQLLSHGAGQATEEVSFAIDNDLTVQ